MMPTLTWRCVNGPGSFVERSINFVSRGCVCHTEFIFPDGTAIGAHASGGVKVRPIDFYPVDFRFSADVTEEQYGTAIAFLRQQIGKPYDFTAILGILINRNWENPKSWYCSELVTSTLQVAGIIGRFPSAVTNVTPQDVLLYSSAMFPTPK